jgi:hypothetical protein
MVSSSVIRFLRLVIAAGRPTAFVGGRRRLLFGHGFHPSRFGALQIVYPRVASLSERSGGEKRPGEENCHNVFHFSIS